MAIANAGSTKHKVGSWVSLSIVLAGLITGLVLIAVYTLNWILIYLLATLFVVLLLSAAFYLSYPNAWKPILFMGAALIFISLVVGSGFIPLSIPIAVTVGGIALFFAILWARRHGGYVLFGNWHLQDKGLGGSIFADIANMVGVFAGIGAYRFVTGNPMLVKAWWWVGQFAALLAAVVSLSLLWRWVFPPAGGLNDDQRAQKWPALFNWLVAAGTIVSLYAPTPSNRSFVRLDEAGPNGAPAAIYWLVVLAILVVVFIIMLISRIKRFFEEWQASLVTVLFMIITVAAAVTVGVAIWAAHNGQDWSTAGTIIAIIAVFAWISGEFINFVTIVRGWKPITTYLKVIEYLDWEKNFWEIIGGLGTILFIAGNTWRSDWQNLNDYLFVVAAALGFLGTLRGIFRGVLKRLYNENYEDRMLAQIGQVQGQAAQRQQLFLAASDRAAQRRGVIQVRDATILQQTATLAQRNTTIQDLQQQIVDRDGQITLLRDRVGVVEDRAKELDVEVRQKTQRLQEVEAEMRRAQQRAQDTDK